MPKQLIQYRIFIGSPSGLEEERKCFRERIDKFTVRFSEPRGVIFHPVGWEDTIGGAGRPQALINEDLKQCDYAVFILHDRWGTSPGGSYTSGTEEEFKRAEELYEAKKIRNIMLFFKAVDLSRLRDRGPQLRKVISFKKRIEEGKRYLFRQYSTLEQFSEFLDNHLARWLNDHEVGPSQISLGGRTSPVTITSTAAEPISSIAPPPFDYWIEESDKLLERVDPNYAGALFCAEKATEVAQSDMQWERARRVSGMILVHLGKLDAALSIFEETAERFSHSLDPDRRYCQALGLYNKGVTLGALDRSAEEIATYDEMFACFDVESDSALGALIARALVNKGSRLQKNNRSEEAIALYNEVLTRFGAVTEPTLHEPIAKALINKAARLYLLNRSAEAIATCDEVHARFGTASNLLLREQVAQALCIKGMTILTLLGRATEAIVVYNEVLARFGVSSEDALREKVAEALYYKGMSLSELDRWPEAIEVYDDLLSRFGTASEPGLRKEVANVLVRKGGALHRLKRNEEAIIVFDEVLSRFGTADEPELRERVANVLLDKGVGLGVLDRSEEAIAAYDELLARFGTTSDPKLREWVAKAIFNKGVRLGVSAGEKIPH